MSNIWRREPSGRIVSRNLLPLPNKGVSNIIANAVFEVTAPPATNNYTLSANPRSYSLGGVSATLTKVKSLLSSPGTYSTAGSIATITKVAAKILIAESSSYVVSLDSYSLTLFPVTFISPVAINVTLFADKSEYLVSGKPLAMTKVSKRTLSCLPESYVLNGKDITFEIRNPTLKAFSGSYALLGSPADLLKPRTIIWSLDSGVYVYAIEDYILKGLEAVCVLNRRFITLPTSYSIIGYKANDPDVILEPSSYSIFGSATELRLIRYLTPELLEYSILGSHARMSQQYQYPQPQFVLKDTNSRRATPLKSPASWLSRIPTRLAGSKQP